jgi:metal-responsive CopG/Arc/MetJ family transcriptional regulator
MSAPYTPTRKITISLPDELVTFADQRALETNASRSQVISLALEHIKALEEEQLASEGYRFYTAEAEEFAAISATAVTEAVTTTEEGHHAG